MTHNRQILDSEEKRIHTNLIRMSHMVEQALERAFVSMKLQDKSLANQVIEEDKRLNEYLRIIDEECLSALTHQKPEEADVRDIVASMHIAVELERMADHAVNIAKVVKQMDGQIIRKTMDQLGRMSDACGAMLNRAMEAFENRDAELAEAVAGDEEMVDELEKDMIDVVLKDLSASPDFNARCIHHIWVAHSLERISDRITNVAERVIFMVTGEAVDLGR